MTSSPLLVLAPILLCLNACALDPVDEAAEIADTQLAEQLSSVMPKDPDLSGFVLGFQSDATSLVLAVLDHESHCTLAQYFAPWVRYDVEICDNTRLRLPASAGDIAVTGGLRDVSLAPAADGSYAPDFALSPLFAGIERISFAATGDVDGIGAFERSFRAPASAELVEPAAVLQDPPPTLLVDRTRPFPVAWRSLQSPPTGDFIVQIHEPFDETDTEFITVTVRFYNLQGRGAIPPEAIQALPAGPAVMNFNVESRRFTAADDDIVELVLNETVNGVGGGGNTVDVVLD